ncbi:hypothetical protein H4R34_000035 [Dimargaris verticillata]|uniref:Fork-head domain-containing protein n=1 Tax=Dimargaris verticillata TaxID=2761393 RepID=A0A9W8EF21_9FUNG|nr:hypothetical protein H4R34_000035 [Dimargaris verticillata]
MAAYSAVSALPASNNTLASLQYQKPGPLVHCSPIDSRGSLQAPNSQSTLPLALMDYTRTPPSTGASITNAAMTLVTIPLDEAQDTNSASLATPTTPDQTTSNATASSGSTTPPTPNAKPNESYASLIMRAIYDSPTKKMTLNSIYNWVQERYPYFQTAPPGWKNSIRHNLSLNKAFHRIPRAVNEPGKGSYWTIDMNYVNDAHRPKGRYNRSTSDPHPYPMSVQYYAAFDPYTRRPLAMPAQTQLGGGPSAPLGVNPAAYPYYRLGTATTAAVTPAGTPSPYSQNMLLSPGAMPPSWISQRGSALTTPLHSPFAAAAAAAAATAGQYAGNPALHGTTTSQTYCTGANTSTLADPHASLYDQGYPHALAHSTAGAKQPPTGLITSSPYPHSAAMPSPYTPTSPQTPYGSASAGGGSSGQLTGHLLSPSMPLYPTMAHHHPHSHDSSAAAPAAIPTTATETTLAPSLVAQDAAAAAALYHTAESAFVSSQAEYSQNYHTTVASTTANTAAFHPDMKHMNFNPAVGSGNSHPFHHAATAGLLPPTPSDTFATTPTNSDPLVNSHPSFQHDHSAYAFGSMSNLKTEQP